MNTELIKILVDPFSKESFKLFVFESEIIKYDSHNEFEDIYAGVLLNSDNVGYPIIRGIPRLFAGAFSLFIRDFKNYRNKISALKLDPATFVIPKEFEKLYLPTLARFQKEWLNHNIDEKTWGLTQKERINKLIEYLSITKSDFNDKLYLDLGCGTGQLTCTTAKELNCNAIGLDLSCSIERGEIIRRSLFCRNRINFIQANLVFPPFKENSFDIIHSSGVLHHTPDTKNSFDKIQVLTKSGGKLGIWLYRKGYSKLPIIPFVNPEKFGIRSDKIRKYSWKLNPSLLYTTILLYVSIFHFMYKVNSIIRGVEHTQTIKERVTSLFDSYAPPFVHRHDPGEVKNWFKKTGYIEIIETDNENSAGFNISGTKI